MHYFTQLLVKVLLTIRPRKISGTCQNLPIFQPQINKCFFQGFFLKAKSLLWSKKSLHKKDKLAADCRGLCWLLIIVCPLFDRCCQCHPTKGCSGSADCQTMWQCCSWSDGTVISICHNNNNLRRIINSIYAFFFSLSQPETYIRGFIHTETMLSSSNIRITKLFNGQNDFAGHFWDLILTIQDICLNNGHTFTPRLWFIGSLHKPQPYKVKHYSLFGFKEVHKPHVARSIYSVV